MTKETSTLDQMKGIEERKQKAQLLKILSLLKEAAKNVNEWKEICNLYLHEVCKDEKEQKRIIDWINNLADVQLTAERKEELKEKTQKELKDEKKKVEKQFEEKPELHYLGQSFGVTATASGSCSSSLSRSNALNGNIHSNYAVSNVSGLNVSNDSLNINGMHFSSTPTGLIVS